VFSSFHLRAEYYARWPRCQGAEGKVEVEGGEVEAKVEGERGKGKVKSRFIRSFLTLALDCRLVKVEVEKEGEVEVKVKVETK
jgi:hypothetical protein